MQEETKEEYLARHRKEKGIESFSEELVEDVDSEQEPVTFKSRLKSLFFLLLFGLFLFAILQIFGMLKSN